MFLQCKIPFILIFQVLFQNFDSPNGRLDKKRSVIQKKNVDLEINFLVPNFLEKNMSKVNLPKNQCKHFKNLILMGAPPDFIFIGLIT